jgi:hypothetical protein
MVCIHNYINITYGKLSYKELLELKEQGGVYGGEVVLDTEKICMKCFETYPETVDKVVDNYAEYVDNYVDKPVDN